MNRKGLSFFGRFGLAAFVFSLPTLVASAAAPTLTAPADGATVEIHTPTQRDYLNKSMEARRAIGTNRTEHSKLTVPYDQTRWKSYKNAGTFPHPVKLTWSGTGPFGVEIRRTSDNMVFFATNGLTAKTVDVFNFEIGCQYTWKVSNGDGASAARTFTTDNVFPRLLWDRAPAGEIYGVRELGGCYVSNGAYRVKQGLVFRSSKLNDNAEKGSTVPGASFVSDANRSTWLNGFGVRYELDLRGYEGEAGSLSTSPLGSTVAYKHVSGIDYSIAGSASNKKAIKSELDYALDPTHYPLVFHCSIGHDRTGTLAILMHGLLGVSEDDMMRNYESSWFWYCKGTDDGVAGHYKGINTLHEHLSTYAGATMADRIVAYCKDIGITQSQIDTFRNAMLEPVDAPAPTTKKVWSVLGDSYSTWAGLAYVTYAYYPTTEALDPSMSGAANMSRTWWSQVISHFDGTLGSVVASGGSRIAEDVLSEPPVGSFEHRAQNGELGDPDYILFMGGLNDKWHDVPTDTMFSTMNSLCAMLNEKYAKAQKIFLLTKLPGKWGCGIPSDYRSALKQAALDHGCTVVDLEGAYTESGTDLIKAHPTARGMTNFANRVIQTLEGTYVPPTHVHVWGNWVTNVVPTATTDGQRTGTCTADGCSYPFATTVETLPKTGGVDPTAYGAADKSAVTYTWKVGVSGPWEYTTNWTGSAGATYGIPNNATYATALFPSATAAGTTVTLANKTVNVKRLNFENTAAMSLVLDNGKIVEAASESAITAMNVGKAGSVALTFRGAAPQLESKSEYSYRRMYFGECCETRLRFELPATPWTAATAPILASGAGANITFYSNTQFVIDASNLTVPAEGVAVTNVLACASGEGGGIRPWHPDETLPPAEMTLPPGAEGRLAFDCSNGFVYFILTKQQKAEPTAVAKPTLYATWAKMDGTNRKPTIAVEPAGAYAVTYSDGGDWSAAGNYTATCRLTDTTQYVWADGSTADVALTFAVVDTYDYLTTDGNGYIDAGIRPNVKTTRLQAKLRYRDLSVNGMQIGFAESGTRAWGFAYWTGMTAGSLQYYSASEHGDYGVTLSTDFRDEGTVHEIELCANTASLDGVAKSGNPNPSDDSEVAANLTLFSRYGTFAGLKADVHALKIWNGETLVRDFIPAKDLNGKATLYDACSNVYMTVTSFSGLTAAYSVHNCTKIGEPSVTASLPYDSTTKRPVAASDTYTLGGDATAIVPGAYTVTVTPNSGYTWQDGSRETKSFDWAITGQFAKAARAWGWQTTATIGGEEYHICAFTNSASWTVPANVSTVDFLVVGGGGAGGASGATKDYRSGGGGGAGGVVTGRMDVVTGNALTVTVGAGGVAVATAEQAGGNGGESSIKNGMDNLVTVSGGGAGGYAASAGTAGSAGGSGGGGSSKNSSTGTTNGGGVTAPTVANGIAYRSFGAAGGKGYGKQYAGGGGGAGGAGAQNASAPGEGGAGVMLWISGEEAVYAAGGKGGYSQYSEALSEVASTGNGGHGAYRSGSSRYVPTSGGSGIVVIRYVLSSGPAPHEHRYGEWYVSQEPTLAAFGEKRRDCDCGVSETVQLPKLEKWIEIPTGFTESNTIICLGDSLTHGYGADDITIPNTPNYFDGRMDGVEDKDNYPYRLAASIPAGYNVLAQSKDGKATDAIVSWFGGIPMKTTYKFTLPTAADELVQIPTNILFNGTDGGAQHEKFKQEEGANYNWRYYGLLTPYVSLSEAPVKVDGLTGWLGGVHVRLGENHATYRTICRTEAGEAVEIPAGATFVPDAQLCYQDAVKVICAGANDGKEKTDQFLLQISNAVVRTGSTRYVVISGHNMADDRTATAESTYERKFRTMFGERHLNLRLAMVERGVATAQKLGFTSVTQWNVTGATGLLSDGTHYNTAGYAVMAQFVKEKLQSLGYLPADPTPVDPTQYGSPDTSAVTYTWKAGVTGPWEYTTNWTASATPCYGIPNATKATACFPATLPADTVVTLTNSVNVAKVDCGNTAAMTLVLDNGKITISVAKVKYAGQLDVGKTGPATVAFRGERPQLKALSEYSFGRMYFGLSYATKLSFALPSVPWTTATAPILSTGEEGNITFYDNATFEIDAAGLSAPEAGQSRTYVLACATGNSAGLRGGDSGKRLPAVLPDSRVALRNLPAGTTGIVTNVNDTSLCFILTAAAGDPVQQTVEAAKSGASVLPSGVTLADVTLAEDGRSFTCGGKTYTKAHYVFQASGDTLIAVIAKEESAITSAGVSASGTFVVGGVDPSVVGFFYAAQYAPTPAGEWTTDTATTTPGTGGPLTVEASMDAEGNVRFYRLVVTDAETK